MNPVCDAYHEWYYSQEVWAKTTFLGIRSAKSVSDMWNYQEILTELKPSFILEFGTFRGGSTLYFAEIMKLINPKFKILTVDIDHREVTDTRVRQHDRIEMLESDTKAPHVGTRIEELRREFPGKMFCIVDSDHSKEQVLGELMLLRGLTLPGDYVIVEDSNINGHPVLPGWGEGPYEALEEYLAKYPNDYRADTEREVKFGFTFAPKGFLIRN